MLLCSIMLDNYKIFTDGYVSKTPKGVNDNVVFSPLTPDVCYWFLRFQCQCPVRHRTINTQCHSELFLFLKKWKISKESNSLKTQITTLTWSFVPSCVMEMWAGSSWPIRRKKDFQWRIKKRQETYYSLSWSISILKLAVSKNGP